IDLNYVGTNFHGWQSQPDGSAVQDVMEKALATVFGKFHRLAGAARTDSGVHAENQVATFTSDLEIDLFKTQISLQSLIPKSIGIAKVSACARDFHPITCAKAKIYRYQLHMSTMRNAFHEPYCWRVAV